VIDATGNRTLKRVVDAEPFARTYITAAAPGIDLHWLAERHEPILDAIRDGDPERAEAAMHPRRRGRRDADDFEHPEIDNGDAPTRSGRKRTSSANPRPRRGS
jgi:hypothetical protein